MDLVGTQHPPFSTSRRGNNMYTGAESRRGYRRGREKRPPELKKKKKRSQRDEARIRSYVSDETRQFSPARSLFLLPSFLPSSPAIPPAFASHSFPDFILCFFPSLHSPSYSHDHFMGIDRAHTTLKTLRGACLGFPRGLTFGSGSLRRLQSREPEELEHSRESTSTVDMRSVFAD